MDAHFASTRWSLVARAGAWRAGAENPAAREALAQLVLAYWPALYAFARAQGRDATDAEDLVQGFFARAVEKGDIAPRERQARFRSFLCAAFQHYCANEHARERAHKRGGDRRHLPLEVDALADSLSSPGDTPERAFERCFARRVLARTLEQLREEEKRGGHAERFAVLEPLLTEPDATLDRNALAARLGISAGALKVALHRLRKRYGELLRREVAGTLEDERAVEDELRELARALAH